MAEKNYMRETGTDEFYYAVLDETGAAVIKGLPERVKFFQNMNIEMTQEITKAWGDNRVAEMAVSSGDITVTSAFHKIPVEDRAILFGFEQTTNGIYGLGSEDTPPYVAVVFAKTYNDGSKEWVGLPKGIFTRPNITAQTKEGGSTEFGSDEITAEFMDREIAGFNKMRSVIFGKDEVGSTTARDDIFQSIFGVGYPETEPEGA